MAKKKKESYEDAVVKSKVLLKNLDIQINDNHGKIAMLEEIRDKIKNSYKNSPKKRNEKLVDEENLDNEEEELDEDAKDYERRLEDIFTESSRITEALKGIKNDQETNFYDYLKQISKSMVHQKGLKKI